MAGAIADRVDRRWLLMVAGSAAMAFDLLLVALVATGALTIWSLLLVVGGASAAAAFDATARQSIIPRLVPRAQLMSAIGLFQMSFNLPQVIGPAIGGALFGPIGITGIVLLGALSRLGLVVAAYWIGPVADAAAGVRPSVTVWRSVIEGLTYVRAHPVIGPVFVVAILAALLVQPYIALLPAFAATVLATDARGLALLMSASGVGAIAGSLLTSNLAGRIHRGPLFLASAIVLSVTGIAFAIQADVGRAAIAVACLGFGYVAFNGQAMTVLQSHAREEMRGRVVSLHSMLWICVIPVGTLALGSAGGLVGVDVAMLGGSLITAVAVAVAAWRSQGLRSTAAPASP